MSRVIQGRLDRGDAAADGDDDLDSEGANRWPSSQAKVSRDFDRNFVKNCLVEDQGGFSFPRLALLAADF